MWLSRKRAKKARLRKSRTFLLKTSRKSRRRVGMRKHITRRRRTRGGDGGELTELEKNTHTLNNIGEILERLHIAIKTITTGNGDDSNKIVTTITKIQTDLNSQITDIKSLCSDYDKDYSISAMKTLIKKITEIIDLYNPKKKVRDLASKMWYSLDIFRDKINGLKNIRCA